ncbi:MAG: tyrosine-protein kinase family protein [Nitrospiria bacterium]
MHGDFNENISKEGIVVLDESASLLVDRYRLLFAKIDLVSRKEGKRVIAITSAVKGEGKTTTTSNLAVIAARDFGKRCLVIDGDCKNPSLGKRFGIYNNTGLLNIVSEECGFPDAVVQGPVASLSVLTMGKQVSDDRQDDGRRDNAYIWTDNGIVSILEKVRDDFDYILIDAPPILPLFDMSVISEVVDGIVLVVKTGETPEAVLTKAVKTLGPKKIIGSVLNRAKTSWKYGYDRYRYEYDHYQG